MYRKNSKLWKWRWLSDKMVESAIISSDEAVLTSAGMEKLQKSMTVYVKSLSKRNEIEDKEKILPVAYLGQTMIHHGEDFEPDSDFGNCLIGMQTGSHGRGITDGYRHGQNK